MRITGDSTSNRADRAASLVNVLRKESDQGVYIRLLAHETEERREERGRIHQTDVDPVTNI